MFFGVLKNSRVKALANKCPPEENEFRNRLKWWNFQARINKKKNPKKRR